MVPYRTFNKKKDINVNDPFVQINALRNKKKLKKGIEHTVA